MLSSFTLIGIILLCSAISCALLPILPAVDPSTIRDVPVVYVIFGEIPFYLLINIELASRHNRVVVITDQTGLTWNFSAPQAPRREKVEFVNAGSFMKGAVAFSQHYVHMSRDNSAGRQRHELRCFQRWYILRDYMASSHTSLAFFGDGDSSVFVNITEAFQQRGQCSAVINVEAQGSNVHWVGAGESSLWTLDAIADFCDFTMEMYSRNLKTLQIKGHDRPSVVDMSLLWLWWAAHHRHEGPGWDVGRPFHTEMPNTLDVQRRSDAAFTYATKLPLPGVNENLRICNGLDVVARTVFDHYHAWLTGKNFSLNLDGNGTPYTIADSIIHGGRPESVDDNEVKLLATQRLYFLNIHYQGNSKLRLPYDVCRVLSYTGDKLIAHPAVAKICAEELAKMPGLPCANHIGPLERGHVCF